MCDRLDMMGLREKVDRGYFRDPIAAIDKAP